ncbi:MAG TPA: tetratricopeptide repeat protein [Bryobacteraceae bacterium]|nr:tetratricopeptide repeat protein [Bryobacteraceae bacterium]
MIGRDDLQNPQVRPIDRRCAPDLSSFPKAVNKAPGSVLIAAWLAMIALAQQPATLTKVPVDRATTDGHPEQAQKALAELLESPHVGLEMLLEFGAKLAEGEQYEMANAVFARAVHDYPRNFEAHYNLALADVALRRFDEARAVLEAPVELSGEQRLAREYLRGKVHEATGQPALAERCYTAAFSGAPQQENYALDLGLFYLRQRNHAKARETLAAGVRYHQKSIYLLLGMGLAEYLDNDPPGAAETCSRILTIEPQFAPAQLLRAVAHYTSGENEKCLKESAAVINRPGAPPYLYYLHAASLLKLGSKDYGAMLADLEVAAHAMTDCSFCYLALSRVHQEMGNERAAIADLEILVERVDREFSNGWYRLANLYQHAGRTADAAGALKRFESIKTAHTNSEAEYLGKFLLPELGGESGKAR